MGADVFCKAFIRAMAHIQAAKIHSYRQRWTFFEPACNDLHRHPTVLGNLEGWVSGRERPGYHTPARADIDSTKQYQIRKNSGPPAEGGRTLR